MKAKVLEANSRRRTGGEKLPPFFRIAVEARRRWCMAAWTDGAVADDDADDDDDAEVILEKLPMPGWVYTAG